MATHTFLSNHHDVPKEEVKGPITFHIETRTDALAITEIKQITDSYKNVKTKALVVKEPKADFDM